MLSMFINTTFTVSTWNCVCGIEDEVYIPIRGKPRQNCHTATDSGKPSLSATAEIWSDRHRKVTLLDSNFDIFTSKPSPMLLKKYWG